MSLEPSLLAALSAREFSVRLIPHRTVYPEILSHTVDLSAHFAFPAARDFVHFAVAPGTVLDEVVFEKLDEQINAYGFRDRLKIIEFTSIDSVARELLASQPLTILLDRTQLSMALRSLRALAPFLRRLFASSVPFQILNPYVFRGPVTGLQFFGRENEIATLRAQAHRSFVISGARRSGKTSLLMETKRRLDSAGASDDKVVYLSFENCGEIADVPRAIFNALSADFDGYRRLAESSRWVYTRNLPRLADHLWKYVQLQRQSTRVVRFFFDEYDSVIALERAHGRPTITSALREVLARHKTSGRAKGGEEYRVQFAFSGTPVLYDELLSGGSPMFNFASKLQMNNFDLRTIEALLTQPLRDLEIRVPDPANVAQAILEITGGHPSTTQNLCATLVDEFPNEHGAEVTRGRVERTALHASFLGEFADSLNHNIAPLGRYILAQMARSKRALFDLEFFMRSATAHSIRLERPAVSKQLTDLKDSGYMTVVDSAQHLQFKLAIATIQQVYRDSDPRDLVPEMLAAGQCTRVSSA
ncbi:MAG TPA: ATP-binding protein [Thermoanaerobaculia bacterium]|nr:ATP-binding protein [Thermoanaerobaculia bacterium]